MIWDFRDLMSLNAHIVCFLFRRGWKQQENSYEKKYVSKD